MTINEHNPEKSFVLDTNILLHDAESIYAFEDNEVIIPREVLYELDKMKRKNDHVGHNARQVSRYLKQHFENYIVDNKEQLEDRISVKINDNGLLSLYREYRPYINIKADLTSLDAELKKNYKQSELQPVSNNMLISNNTAYKYMDRVDARLLEVACCTESILVTNDIILQIQAIMFGIPVEDFKAYKADKEYKGYRDIQAPSELIDELYSKESVPYQSDELVENEFAILKSATSQSGLAQYKNKRLIRVNQDIEASGIRPRNTIQRLALNLLMDTDIELVALTGLSGSGKTLLALAAGLEQIDNINRYRRILVSRPNVSLGKGYGYLPGTIEEKLDPWLKPIYDNLELIFDDNSESAIESLKDYNKLKAEPLQYIRGRSLPYNFFIIDEAQNIPPANIKAIISRAGEGSKIVLTGDIQQIDEPYLSRKTNAISYVIDRFKGQDNFGHIEFSKTERSRLASQAAILL